MILSVAALLAACSPSKEEDGGYEPLPDETLFAQAEQVEGVQESELAYRSTWGNSGYHGKVTLDPRLAKSERPTVMNTVYAILRQGRYWSPITIQWIQDNTILRNRPGTPQSGAPVDLEEFFGPQPGTGKPPGADGR